LNDVCDSLSDNICAGGQFDIAADAVPLKKFARQIIVRGNVDAIDRHVRHGAGE
jgi:hypothetical protein